MALCDLLLPSLLPSLRPRLLAPARPRLGLEVEEREAGWELSLGLPGAKAADVTAEVARDAASGDAELRLFAAPFLPRPLALPLPPDASLDDVAASVVDGELRVAVPRRPADAPLRLAVKDAAEGGAEGEREASDAVTMQWHVPGAAAKDVAVTVAGGELRLEVTRGGLSARLARTLPPDVDAARAEARVVDGVLTVALPRLAPLALEIAAEPLPEPAEDAAGTVEEVLLGRVALPGVSAASLEAEVRGRRVTVRRTGDGERVVLRAPLPGGADAASLRAACAHGLLTLTAAVPKGERVTTLAVAAHAVAALPGDEAEAAARNATPE